MFGSEVLDIVISLIFIYLLYSLLATIIQEIIATHFGFRAKILEKGVMRMLDDDYEKDCTVSIWYRIQSFLIIFKRQRKQPPITKDFYNHPLVKFLGEDKWHSKPAYLSPQIFSKVVIDLLRGKNLPAGTDFRPLIEETLKNKKIAWGDGSFHEDTSEYLRSLWADAQGDVEKFKVLIENWYDETMARVSGWYKQYTQVILFFVGLAIAIVFNVDTIKIVGKLEKDPKLREQLVAQADAFVKAHPNLDKELAAQKEQNKKDVTGADSAKKVKTLNADADAEYNKLKAKRDSLLDQATQLVQGDIEKANNLLAIGHGTQKIECCSKDYGCIIGSFLKSLLGWILTAIAISLGAPFWFDLLSKLIKIRGSFKTPSKEEKTAAANKVVQVNPKG